MCAFLWLDALLFADMYQRICRDRQMYVWHSQYTPEAESRVCVPGCQFRFQIPRLLPRDQIGELEASIIILLFEGWCFHTFNAH